MDKWLKMIPAKKPWLKILLSTSKQQENGRAYTFPVPCMSFQPCEIKTNGDLIGSDNKWIKTIKNCWDCLTYGLTFAIVEAELSSKYIVSWDVSLSEYEAIRIIRMFRK